jgi:large-conductance mechanosensitive channel
MSDTIIDVVPRIHSDFVMPAVETIEQSSTIQPEVPKSTKKKIMVDLGNFFMKYKFYIVLIIVFIIVLMYTYYYINTKRKREKQLLINSQESKPKQQPQIDDQPSVQEIVKQEEYYNTDIDEHIDKIINNPSVSEETVTNIENKISSIIDQTEISDNGVNASHIDQQINKILQQDKSQTIVNQQINNLLKPSKDVVLSSTEIDSIEPFVDENIVNVTID